MRSTRGRATCSGRSPTASTRRSSRTPSALYLVGYAKVYGLVEKRSATVRKLSERSALRALRQAGLHRLKVVGTHPLAIRVGRPPKGKVAVEHVCHMSVRGATSNVRWAGGVLQKACR